MLSITSVIEYYKDNFSFQTELCELREEVSELKSSRFKADARLRQLDLSISEKDAEISRLSTDLNQVVKA